MPPKLKSKSGTTATGNKQTSTSKGKDSGSSGVSGAQSGSHSTVNCVCGSPIDSGHMVECESCSCWSHVQCIGLSPSCASTYPYICPFCVRLLVTNLSELRSEVAFLRNKIESIESSFSTTSTSSISSEIESINDQLRLLSSRVDSSPDTSQTQTNTSETPSRPVSNHTVNHDGSRRGNLVITGLPECPQGTTRVDRFLKDQETVASILSTVSPSVNSQSVKDLFRLGRYRPDQSRPILVKFFRSWDATVVLRNKSKLADSPNISIRPDLSPSQKTARSLLLRERRTLMTSGNNAGDIKIRGNKIFLRDSLYGEVNNNSFVRALAPGDSDTSNTTDSATVSSTLPPSRVSPPVTPSPPTVTPPSFQ
ncbi:PREDICTED: SET domain-containing protein 3-like [Amphimedon queenslandica]|nr:PREDICTED: SET domain-containing protein 3-like [Amphimedon queenslandica]|eukprot:XP_019859975.1 PREDICTED: SET domain-containing protein 3-like [Amphimedon queenslandica]